MASNSELSLELMMVIAAGLAQTQATCNAARSAAMPVFAIK